MACKEFIYLKKIPFCNLKLKNFVLLTPIDKKNKDGILGIKFGV